MAIYYREPTEKYINYSKNLHVYMFTQADYAWGLSGIINNILIGRLKVIKPRGHPI